VGGGGRYDGLVEQLGGPPTPAIGWAAGVERILLALDDVAEPPGRDVFVAAADEAQRPRALAIVTDLRHAGLSAETDLAGRRLRGQLKQADRIGARQALILEADGSAQLRDMQSGEQRRIHPGEAVSELTGNREPTT
jgi:histidyl-tRNA synthetase